VISSFLLSPGASRQVEVVFRPTDTRSYQGLLSIFSNDYENPRRNVVFSGEGVVRKIVLLGDVNADQAINIFDALLILSKVEGYTLPQRVNIEVGDVDGNGVIDKADVNLILSFAIGLHTPYPIGQPIEGGSASTVLAADNSRSGFYNRLSPKTQIHPSEWTLDGQLIYDLPHLESDGPIQSTMEACLYELTWDPSMLSFVSFGPENCSEVICQFNALGGNRLLLAVVSTRGLSRKGQPRLMFHPLGDIPQYQKKSLAITIRCLEKFSDKMEHLSAAHENDIQPQDSKLKLYQNQPNPFNPATSMRFYIPEGGDFPQNTKLAIYNIRGKKIRTLLSRALWPGWYNLTWNGVDEHGIPVASGVYFYRLRFGDTVLTKKMLLIK